LRLELRRDRSPLPDLARRGGRLDLLVVLRLGWVDPLLHERKQLLTQVEGPGVVAEIHGAQPPGSHPRRMCTPYLPTSTPIRHASPGAGDHTSRSLPIRRPDAYRPARPSRAR